MWLKDQGQEIQVLILDLLLVSPVVQSCPFPTLGLSFPICLMSTFGSLLVLVLELRNEECSRESSK